METIAFTVPGPPVPKGRPRVTRAGHAFTPKRTRDYEALVNACAKRAAEGRTFAGPVEVWAIVWLPRPKRLMRQRDPEGTVPCFKRPDIDNVLKAVLDGMGALWDDDGQVQRVIVEKCYAPKAQPHGEVRVQVRGELATNDDGSD